MRALWPTIAATPKPFYDSNSHGAGANTFVRGQWRAKGGGRLSGVGLEGLGGAAMRENRYGGYAWLQVRVQNGGGGVHGWPVVVGKWWEFLVL